MLINRHVPHGESERMAAEALLASLSLEDRARYVRSMLDHCSMDIDTWECEVVVRCPWTYEGLAASVLLSVLDDLERVAVVLAAADADPDGEADPYLWSVVVQEPEQEPRYAAH